MPEFREIERAQLQGILESHHLWVTSSGANGHRADLSRYDLRDIRFGDLTLEKASFCDALLDGVAFGGASLGGSDFRGAHLKGAAFEQENSNNEETWWVGADLTDTDFRSADLRDAKLGHVKGLQAHKLAGADLSNARLPDDISRFAGLEQVEKTSGNTRKLFFGMLLACVYSWLAVASTDDVGLLTNSESSPLPIIQTEIPIAGFYWAAPLILLCLYFYLHLYLQRLWGDLAALPAVFPDGRTLDKRAYPWLLNGLVLAHFSRLKDIRPPLSRLENAVSIFLAWWVVPLTLLGFWFRYLTRQDWPGTIFHIVCIVLATSFALFTYILAQRTLQHFNKKFWWKKPWRNRQGYAVIATLLVGMVVFTLSFGVVEGGVMWRAKEREGWFPVPNDVFAHHQADTIVPGDPRKWVPIMLRRLGYFPFANFNERILSARPDDYWQIPEDKKLDSVTGVDLRSVSLRHARLRGAFLAKADLREADLRGADLGGANLEQAWLLGADLRGARLFLADLNGAIFTAANLSGTNINADLTGARLNGANLSGAKLTGYFSGADLSGADLSGADISGTYLPKVNLSATNLRGAKNISCDQITESKNWTSAYRDSELACGEPIPSPGIIAVEVWYGMPDM